MQPNSNENSSPETFDPVPPVTPVFSAAFLSRSFSVRGALRQIWVNRAVFLSVVAVFFLIGLYQAHMIGPSYIAMLDIQPAETDMNAGSNGSSSVGSLLGSITDTSSSGAHIPEFIQFQAALSSNGVAKELDKRYNMLCRVFKGQCDLRTHRWRHVGGLRAWIAGFAASLQGLPDPNGPRTSLDLAAYVLGRVDITKQKTGIVTLSYQDSDPVFAADFVEKLWYTTNNYLKIQDRQIRQDYLAYLNQRIDTTTSLAQREAIQNLLLEVERRMMQSAADVPYAAEVLDGPRVEPVNRVWRTLTIYVFAGCMIGMALSLLAQRIYEVGREIFHMGEPAVMTVVAAILRREFTVSDYLLWSTIASVFLQQLVFRSGADFYLGYFVVGANFLIMLASGQLVIHRAHLAILTLVMGVAFIAAGLAGTPLTSPIAQIVGIAVMSVFYFSYVATQKNNLFRLMDIYSACALAVVVYGIVQYIILRILAPPSALRLTSIFVEPALLVNATLPAFSYYFFHFLRDRSHKTEVGIFAVGYALADSSLGFLGILIMIAIAFAQRMTFWRALAGFIVIPLLAGAAYVSSANLRLRVNGTFIAASTQNLDKSNQSTYAILSNAYVSYRSFLEHPFIGIGLGGHQFAYTRYVGQVVNQGTVLYGQNITDANSMLLRLVSEAGLMGVAGLVLFFAYFSRAVGEKYRFLQRCFIPYFIVRISRDGHYFSLELYFFLAIYVLCFLESRIMNQSRLVSMGFATP